MAGRVQERFARVRAAKKGRLTFTNQSALASRKSPVNSESQFIGWCLRELRKAHQNMILVSYADTKPSKGAPRGHLGTVYMASNWTYTGTSTPFADKVRGEMIERSSKHRYVYFVNAADKKLRQWEVRPYPKRSNRGTCGENAHLRSVCRYKFLPYPKRHTASEAVIAEAIGRSPSKHPPLPFTSYASAKVLRFPAGLPELFRRRDRFPTLAQFPAGTWQPFLGDVAELVVVCRAESGSVDQFVVLTSKHV